jgi:hypothetical protein
MAVTKTLPQPYNWALIATITISVSLSRKPSVVTSGHSRAQANTSSLMNTQIDFSFERQEKKRIKNFRCRPHCCQLSLSTLLLPTADPPLILSSNCCWLRSLVLYRPNQGVLYFCVHIVHFHCVLFIYTNKCTYRRRVQKKTELFAIQTLLFILQHFKHCPLRSSPLYWRYTVPNVSSIVGMLPGTHFL